MNAFLKRLSALETAAKYKLGTPVAVVEQQGEQYIYKGSQYTEKALEERLQRDGVEVLIIDNLMA